MADPRFVPYSSYIADDSFVSAEGGPGIQISKAVKRTLRCKVCRNGEGKNLDKRNHETSLFHSWWATPRHTIGIDQGKKLATYRLYRRKNLRALSGDCSTQKNVVDARSYLSRLPVVPYSTRAPLFTARPACCDGITNCLDRVRSGPASQVVQAYGPFEAVDAQASPLADSAAPVIAQFDH